MIKPLLLASLLLAAAPPGCGKSAESGVIRLNGAGASFPYPLYSKWMAEYAKARPELKLNYQSIGSGGGIKQISEHTVDFGASDAPMSDEQLARAPGKLAHIPTTVGAVVITYNLPAVPALRLSRESVVGVFLGEIRRWNDERLRADNPGVELPDQAVSVVHRSDGSGTSAIFTEYLSLASPAWKTRVGTGTSVNWPVGLGGKGNEGVTGQVKTTPGAIGYLELAYAVQSQLPVVALKNRDGAFITPNIESISAAALVSLPPDLRVSIVDAPGAGAYPLSAFTYVLVYEDTADKAKGEALAKFLWWAVHEGQAFSAPLNYAPLPAPVVGRVERKLRELKGAGQPLLAGLLSGLAMALPADQPLTRERPRWLLQLGREVNLGDLAFRSLVTVSAVGTLALLGALTVQMLRAAWLSLRHFGPGFLTGSVWDPVHDVFGALPFLYGTLASSLLALLLAVPVALGVAIFLVEIAPGWMRFPLGLLVELLAAVPSVIYGLWGLFVLAPWLRATVEPLLGRHLGFLPLFRGAPQGLGMLAGGVILAIMILPSICTVSREVLRVIPDSLREGALALGASRWEAVRTVILPASRSGILGAVVLGLGRALGETMAVTMVIGNRPEISASVFDPSYTMASVLANEFTEATGELYLSALAEVGLLLFVVTVLLNLLARLLVWRVARPLGGG